MTPVDLRHLAQNPPDNDVERRELYEAARALEISLERPSDTMSRLSSSVQEIHLAQIGVDMKLFRILAEDESLSLAELADKTGADAVLLVRLLRHYIAHGFLIEKDNGSYNANSITKWLATDSAEGGIYHYGRTIGPVLSALPDVLKQQNYRNPSDSTKTAFQVAFDINIPAYQWVPSDERAMEAFLAFLNVPRPDRKKWFDVFPLDQLRRSDAEESDDRVLLVDVGGSTGGQSIAFREAAGLSGRIILQDLAHTIAKANKADLERHQIEPQITDFFQKQPVNGAKAYYLRYIMHDWVEAKCIEILQRLREAMAEDSLILIDEMVLPQSGASWKQARADIQMMACHASMERSEQQWRDLLRKAGLRLREVVTYDEEMRNAIIVAVKGE
ncbi:O-methyltransferase [Teratosphaeria destructans]|uniref:O-methyltransferase n=1 Tax=Teratosphaeria destructans TaxID=418781 RepID=A0A9W7SLG1_9PEZI|nr:O-methyltransferase [Teratosphaeria destructans]